MTEVERALVRVSAALASRDKSALTSAFEEAVEIADRIAVLHYGELLAEGTKEEVRANQSVQEIYLGVD